MKKNKKESTAVRVSKKLKSVSGIKEFIHTQFQENVKAFLYVIMRDCIPTGKVYEEIIDNIGPILDEKYNFSNKELAKMAERYTKMLCYPQIYLKDVNKDAKS